jgi:hypothetical protein
MLVIERTIMPMSVDEEGGTALPHMTTRRVIAALTRISSGAVCRFRISNRRAHSGPVSDKVAKSGPSWSREKFSVSGAQLNKTSN